MFRDVFLINTHPTAAARVVLGGHVDSTGCLGSKELYNTREKCTVAKLLLPKSTELRNLAQGFSSVDFGFTKSEDHGSAVRFSLCFVEDLLSLFSKGFHSFLFYF